MSEDLKLPSTPHTFPLGAPANAPAASQGSASAAQTDKMKALAQQFEGLLLLQMIREMRQSMTSFGGDDNGDGLMSGTGTMTDTMDTAFAMQLGQSGGFGLSTQLMKSFERQMQSESSNPSGLTIAPGAAAAVTKIDPIAAAAITKIDPVAAAALPEVSTGGPEAAVLPDLGGVLDTSVNSPFGWRTDPIDGTTRFHNGVDLRAAYGQAVPVVGDGTVAFAGEQGGYGLTVVVRHADGIETRYAHLSSIDVQAGQSVRAGQTIGRVGQTGRATGPHLHFEVTENGRPVNPEDLAQRLEP